MNIRRLFSALLIAIMIFIMIPFASAENPLEDTDIVSGTYLGFTYYFNTKTRKLVIRGTGKMPSFENGKAPWSEYSAKATSVVLSKGITSISENAFAGFIALKTISIPETVTEIAATSFTSCEAIEEVEFTGEAEALQELVSNIDVLQTVEITSIEEDDLEAQIFATETEYVEQETARAEVAEITVVPVAAKTVYNKGNDEDSSNNEQAAPAEEIKNGDYPLDRTRNGTRRVGFDHWENGKMIYTSQDVYENGSTTPTYHELLEYDDNEELFRNTRTETKNGHEYTTVHSDYVKVGESKKIQQLYSMEIM